MARRARVEVAVAAGVDPESHLRRPGHRLRQDRRAQPVPARPPAARSPSGPGRPVLVGVSRKRFLASLLGDAARDRTVASVTAGLAALDGGAWGLRVHDVRPHAGRAAGARRDRGGPMREVEIRLDGLAVFGRHGVLPAERELGQRFCARSRARAVVATAPATPTTWPTPCTTARWPSARWRCRARRALRPAGAAGRRHRGRRSWRRSRCERVHRARAQALGARAGGARRRVGRRHAHRGTDGRARRRRPRREPRRRRCDAARRRGGDRRPERA